MPEQAPNQNNPIERKEATNETLNPEEISAVKSIVEATKTNPELKDAKIKEYFDLSLLQNNEKEQIAYLIEKQMLLIYVEYKNNKGTITEEENKEIIKNDKEFLDIAFGLMQLHKPNTYGPNSTFYKTYVKGEGTLTYSSEKNQKTISKPDALKEIFYAAVEHELEKLFVRPSDIFEQYNKEKLIVSQKDYEENKNEYDDEGRKKIPGTERTIEGNPEIIMVPGKPIDLPTQYFYKGRSEVDIDKAIKDKIPELQEQIATLKNNPDIDPTSIEVRVKSSVSNISYDDNEGLLSRRSSFYKDKVENQLPGQKVVVDNKTYTGYGPEWGPTYPPTKEVLQEYFTEGSEGWNALKQIPEFTNFDDVVTSMQNEKANSKYFDVLETYMYRLFQYTTAEVVYQEKKEIPTNEVIFDIERKLEIPNLSENKLNRTAGNIVTRNPFYELVTKGENKYKEIDGVTYPINSEFMVLQFSANRGPTGPIGRKPYAAESYKFAIDKSVTNRGIEERKRGEGKNYSEQLTLLLDGKEETIKNFSENLIGSDVYAGRHITKKETNNFINGYIENNIEIIDMTVEKEKNNRA